MRKLAYLKERLEVLLNPLTQEEFETTITEDLKMMEIVGDMVSHSSDYFDVLAEYAVKLIKSGNAYADDTEGAVVRYVYIAAMYTKTLNVLQMKQQRMDGIASKNREKPVEETLAIFEEMKMGTEEGQRWCLRAKMSIDDVNKAMRDPVIYRCNVANPHHRTG